VEKEEKIEEEAEEEAVVDVSDPHPHRQGLVCWNQRVLWPQRVQITNLLWHMCFCGSWGVLGDFIHFLIFFWVGEGFKRRESYKGDVVSGDAMGFVRSLSTLEIY
jgi:hypothetical protein